MSPKAAPSLTYGSGFTSSAYSWNLRVPCSNISFKKACLFSTCVSAETTLPLFLANFCAASSTRTKRPISSSISGSSLIAPRNILSIASGKFLPNEMAAPFATIVSPSISFVLRPALDARDTCENDCAKSIAKPEASCISLAKFLMYTPPVLLNISIDSFNVSI